MRALVLLSLLTLGMAHPASTQSGISPQLHPEIVRVDCSTGAGSAFRVSPHVLISVNHVTSLKFCTIGGKTFTVVSHVGDFSILKMDETAEQWLKVDCDGFIADHRYEAIGYARAADQLTTVDLTATGEMAGPFAILSGIFTVIPGQSGGAIIDPGSGAVVGTVNTYDEEIGLSGSIPLKDTSLCRS